MMYGGDGWMWGGWILMSLVMVVFWALVITAIVLAIRYLWGQPPDPGQSSSARAAEDVLAERFARGEIDDDEYRQRMTTLREHR